MATRIRVTGLDRALKKLKDADPVYAAPFRRAMEGIGRLAAAYLKTRAARGQTGRLADSISQELDARPVPRFVHAGYVRAGPPMPTRDGFRYPGALQGSDRYHYRSGPLRGQTTKGWISGAKGFVQRQARTLLKAAEREIAASWGTGGS